MAGNAFLRLTQGKPIPAESMATPFSGSKGWMEIGDWSWDIEAETNIQKGSGSALGKPTSGVLSWSHPYDITSPKIMENIVKGTSFDKAEIVMLKQTGDGTPAVYFAMSMEQVFITKVSSKGGEDGNVNQDVEMVFREISIGYLKQIPETNKLDTSASAFGWAVNTQSCTETKGLTICKNLASG